jgi:hypothetical protein
MACTNCGRETCPTLAHGNTVAEEQEATIACERAAHARTRAELAAVRERLGMATHFNVDGYSIWRGADDDWYVANAFLRNLTVDGRWVRPGSETKIEFGKPLRGAEVHPSLDAAFAVLAAARKETTK